MPLRRLPFREVRRRLLAAGFEEVGIIPRHPEIAIGTLRSIVRQAGITGAQLEAL
jgi:hypothetical protein